MSDLQDSLDYFEKDGDFIPRPEAQTVLDVARRVSEADQIWKCIKHDCDVREINFLNKEWDSTEEYCSIEAEWGTLDPKNCEIVRGVFIPVKETDV